jgi:phycocyanobilin lyase subunit alpha
LELGFGGIIALYHETIWLKKELNMSNFDLIQLLKSEKEQERKTAAEALGKLNDKEAVPSLIEALQLEPRLSVAKVVVVALGELEDSRALPVLFALIESSENWRNSMAASFSVQQLRDQIAEALARIADKDALIEKLHHPDERVRRVAAEALGSIRII